MDAKNGKKTILVAEAYKVLTKEVLNNAEKRRKHQLEGVWSPIMIPTGSCVGMPIAL